MKRTVTFREYSWPYEDGERGEFLGSFKHTVEGDTLMDISEKATQFAKEQCSHAQNIEVRVFEIPTS